ncbi:PREDICTED: zinc finger CCCH domain-containing protein 32-like [Tarenaya hassleriana]|uniref:zinc finger CCCH domain-containing protein 32-like n=1 Tax=Tarenaya hassleriana TaxID=28532 RepID=UPI00053C8FA7|nr:PREDICTED: zinc finger CCCH domain-containing protein 32-like [Tarenaya hassleriana]XP_010523986.1 PREDICTED: zinc finger CCCH domain-containing protein 32-like [Tarenaya hassleriana]XP_010523988.1 PREDICTED: zinc finger CCCH domain-containing protein 32-like [Tarenaya hassleriana]XP_010523989.1 PREDICTED: zinc finger CCCH domain-containing protein 32-like [Tarenaya hassleriana]XP_019056718.1 PREDICTED: zinc finger CCCH domain-containing protein 32-like [Tarenaya hassleriana]
MDMYGRNQATNGSQSGQAPEWSSGGNETGLEESMWRLGLSNSETYPERPGVPDCAYYMRTGICGYGSRCRYNHPRDRAMVEAAVRATGDYPERVGEPPCQFYLKTGTCKFGASCKFHHPKNAGGSMSQVPLNIHGYPLREGEKECSHYLKTGQCKFGVTCKFHHPQPAGTTAPASAPQFYPSVHSPIPDQYGGPSSSLRVARPPLLPGSYMQGAYGPMLLTPGVVPIPGWSPYSAPMSPVLSPGAQHAVGATSLYGVTQLSSSTPSVAGVYQSLSSSTAPSAAGNQKEQIFPERPGEPECQYYLRTGDCKFGLSCKFHHPRDRVPPRANCILSPIGLPLRPGVQPCTFYLQNGFCRFGSTCKFDHPMGTLSYNPSASSLVDAPVAPSYPIGSLLGALAPSSSELRPELISGSQKDAYLTGLSSSRSTSSISAGLIFSQSGSLPFPDMQLPSQTTALPLSSGSRITRQGREIRRSF